MTKMKVKGRPAIQFTDAEYISEFPGYLRCAAECNKGIVTDNDLEYAIEYKGQIGMCQLYKGDKGFFIVFFAPDLAIITTPQGIYNNQQSFHSIRTDTRLFIFEEDFSHYEEAFCIMIDVAKGFYLLKKHTEFIEKLLN